jgi:glycerol-3-phosphate acyltransferase PlsY
MLSFFAIAAAYILGCFNTGFYLVRWAAGTDIRTLSSGGTGSRTVGRLLGTKGFVVTLLGDAGKGVVAVWFAQQIVTTDWIAPVALLAVISGHIWPIQLSFRGGKGFATFAGGMLLLEPVVLLSGLLLSTVFLLFLRRTTMSGLLSLTCSPLIWAVKSIHNGASWITAEFSIYCLVVLVVLFGHRDNIRRDFFYSKM